MGDFMKHLISAAAIAAATLAAPAAHAAVLYSLTGSFQSDIDDDPDVEELATFTWAFEFSAADFLTTPQSVAPSSCSIVGGGGYYNCGATQFIDPFGETLGGDIDDAFVGFNVVNADNSGSGTANYFFAGGAFSAYGVYSNAGQPDPSGPTGDGGFVGNAGPATLTVSPLAVPEPATWATMIAGFGLTGGAMRRRSQRRAMA